MKKQNSKILVIIALALTTVALTLGFAAFSTTLNISSNATVTPNIADFKVTIYGMKTEEAANKYAEDGTLTEESLSTTISTPPTLADENMSASIANIDNTNHTISNIKINLVNPSSEVPYYFIIKNEGKYDVYLDLSKYEKESGNYMLINQGTCTAGEGTTQELLDLACPYIASVVAIYGSSGEPISAGENVIKIPKDDYIQLGYAIGYMDTENRADGPFTIEFPEEQLIFSTTK
ncbi:MAG: hypothetical protein J6C28_07360 [Bacilli bacterium]|nr:hypothetical protein [Bacilli bacterium]